MRMVQLSMLAAACLLPLTASAATLLSEDWTGKDGQNGGTGITGWKVGLSSGALATEATVTGGVLQLDPGAGLSTGTHALTVGPTADGGSTFQMFPLNGARSISLSADVYDLPADSGTMTLQVMGGTAGTDDRYEFFVDTGGSDAAGRVIIRKKLSASAATILMNGTRADFGVDLKSGFHTLQMQVDLGATQNTIRILADNALKFTQLDSASPLTFSSGVRPTLYSGNRNQVQFDNIVMTVPEPTSLGLVIGGSLLALRRKPR